MIIDILILKMEIENLFLNLANYKDKDKKKKKDIW